MSKFYIKEGELVKHSELYNIAVEAMKYSYSPYSKFKVGAAVLTSEGKVFTGCNIENSSYGATICAERTALVKAISEGYTNIKAIAIANNGDDYSFPCGICRQFIYEFGDDIEIIVGNSAGELKINNIKDIFPEGFRLINKEY